MHNKKHRLRKLIRMILTPFLKFMYKRYTKKKQQYEFLDIKIDIFPGVFPPRFFYSTKAILQYLGRYKLKGETVLELGAGCGLISLYAAQMQAKVTASDISKTAIENLKPLRRPRRPRCFEMSVSRGQTIAPPRTSP